MRGNANPYIAPDMNPTGQSVERQDSERVAGRRVRVGYVIAASPGLVMLVLFYTLAAHMFAALGNWPSSIGERGFPQPLVIHARVANILFLVLFASCLMLPFAMLVCVSVKRWQNFAKYLLAYFASCMACLVLMLFANSKFLYWWWD